MAGKPDQAQKTIPSRVVEQEEWWGCKQTMILWFFPWFWLNLLTCNWRPFDPADLAPTVHGSHDCIIVPVTWGAYLTGDSRFNSFLPFDRRPFFFLLARSCEPWGSSGIRGTLDGLRGLMVPGRRGRLIGEGARVGTSVPSSLSLLSVDTCRESGGRVESVKRDNRGLRAHFCQNSYQQ